MEVVPRRKGKSPGVTISSVTKSIETIAVPCPLKRVEKKDDTLQLQPGHDRVRLSERNKDFALNSWLPFVTSIAERLFQANGTIHRDRKTVPGAGALIFLEDPVCGKA